jgi:molecular chaperone DnaK (HSP70)
MSTARYIVGIDLGTTNSAVCTIDLQGKTRSLDLLPIDQLVAAGEVAPRPLLPSAVYLPSEHELAAGALTLPWGAPDFAVGLFAREQGARVPGRLVTSAKSWLSHPTVDRTARILPWGATPEVPRLSPVDASARYLHHLRAAWERAHPGHALDDQELILTVPASFDEAARELTVAAAQQAGLGHATLLEEPLAAFYHWLSAHQSRLDEALAGVSLVLVVDVGGGTTDLTLIQAQPTPEGPRLDRIAVGDHLLLGGDNVDLALAKLAEARLAQGALDAAGWGALVEAAREAKEALLADDAPETRSVAVLGRSSRLVGGARKVELTRDEVRALVLDGFFPAVPASARPERRAGLRELGLPYASDPAITRHIAAFLARHHSEGQKDDALLFNGGALKPALVAERLLDVLGAWTGARPRLLVNDSLDLAVARGAAQFGLVRRGEGMRVGGGSPRAYFLGVAAPEGQRAVCLIPRGLPEGSAVPLGGREFLLTVGKPVRFELFSSTSRRAARPGDLVDPGGADDLLQLPPIQTVIRTGSGAAEVAVRIEASVTEIGTLALFCVAGGERFKLEFQLRGGAGDAAVYETLALPRRFADARELVERFYGKKPAPDVDPREVKQLQRNLERVLGERDTWNLPVLRELWSTLWAASTRRRRSADHERQWLMLAGYALRPGFGAPLDDWRTQEMFSLFSQGLQFHQEKAAWDQWWILWRRIAGGLEESAQVAIAEAIRPWLEPAPPGKTRPRPKGPKFEGFEEMVRLVASLERLPVALKTEVGAWLWSRFGTGQPGASSVWVFGRLGARVPFSGAAHQVLPPALAEEWIARLAKLDWAKTEGAPFAATMLARATGDRARDVGEVTRALVVERLDKARAPASWVAMVREPVTMEAADEQRIFGDSLPTGLKLIG